MPSMHTAALGNYTTHSTPTFVKLARVSCVCLFLQVLLLDSRVARTPHCTFGVTSSSTSNTPPSFDTHTCLRQTRHSQPSERIVHIVVRGLCGVCAGVARYCWCCTLQRCCKTPKHELQTATSSAGVVLATTYFWHPPLYRMHCGASWYHILLRAADPQSRSACCSVATPGVQYLVQVPWVGGSAFMGHFVEFMLYIQ